MNLNDTITHYNTDGLSHREVNALNAAGIYKWYQVKKVFEEGWLNNINGIGVKTVSAIKEALNEHK